MENRSLMPRFGFTAIALSALLTTSVSWAVELQVWGDDPRDPLSNTDNVQVQTTIHWHEDDIPVNFLVYRPIGGRVIPPTANPNGISDWEVFDALSDSVQAWNASPLESGFEFAPSVIFSDFFGHAIEINPEGSAQFDGLDMMTFYDQSALGPGVLGVTISYYATEDTDFFSPWLDVDGDGRIDMVLPRSKWKRGEIYDCDIAYTTADGFEFIQLPEDPDDIDFDDTFQDIVLGSIDLQAVATHELGHALGLSHTYLFESTMFPALTEFTNPYEMREPNYDDQLSIPQIYPSVPFAGAGFGGISGSALDGSAIDRINPNNGDQQSPDPLLIHLFQNPVFVGLPDPTFDIDNAVPSQGFVQTWQDSAFGPIRLIGHTLAGREVRIPELAAQPNPTYNSEWEFLGLPPGSDYVIALFPATYQANAVAALAIGGIFEDEYYGGAPVIPYGLRSGVDQNDTTDNTVENALIQTAHDSITGQFTLGVDYGPQALVGHPSPDISYTTIRVLSGEEATNYHNYGQAIGTQTGAVTLNDAQNNSTGSWIVGDGIVALQRTAIIAADNDGVEDDLLVTWELLNSGDVAQQVGLRMMFDTIADTYEHFPFIINGMEYRVGTEFSGVGIPAQWSMVSDQFPDMEISGRLSGPLVTTPDRFVIGKRHLLQNFRWDAQTLLGAEFANPEDILSDGACALYWNPRSIGAGETATFSTIIELDVTENFGPETGISQTTADAVTFELPVDDADVPEFLTVTAGQMLEDINVISNTGDGFDIWNTSTTVGPGGTIELPEPVLGDPVDPTGNFEFPDDTDASIHVDVADVDNDGDLDIVYANITPSDGGANAAINRLYLNGGFNNELGIGNFVDGTFGRNGLPDGPAPFGDDRLPILYDADPDPNNVNLLLINEVSASVNFGDFDGDGWVDLFVGNSASLSYGFGAPNRLFMNRERSFQGETYRAFIDETMGVSLSGPSRLPGILNQPGGPFPFQTDTYSPDETFRCDVGDVDSDGDLDIVVCNSFPIQPVTDAGFPQVGSVPWGSDPEIMTGIPMVFNTRILINNGSGFFRDDSLGADNMFGGGDRPAAENPGISIEVSGDRDRIPPNLWDWNPTNAPIDDRDPARDVQVLLSPMVGGSDLDFMEITGRGGVQNGLLATEGQAEIFWNLGGGFFMNATWGWWDFSLVNFPEFILDPDTNDAYPAWVEIEDNVFRNPYFPVAMIGMPEGHQQDITPPEGNELNTLRQLEDDSWGVAIADLDNDGDNDVVTANMGDAPNIMTNFALANTNRQQFGFGGVDDIMLGTDFARSPDGALFVNSIEDANQGLQVRIDQSGGDPRVRAVDLGDIDLDGDPDAYYAIDGAGHENILTDPLPDRVYFNNGSGDLWWEQTELITANTTLPNQHLKLADIDNDGDLDVVLASLVVENTYLENFLINGPVTPLAPGDMPMFYDATNDMIPAVHNPVFAPNPGLTPFSGHTASVKLLDIDSDDDLDIYTGEGVGGIATNNTLYINIGQPINDGVQTFKPAYVSFPTPQLVQGQVVYSGEGVCDADADGNIDSVEALAPTSTILPQDYDGDGDWDIFVVNNGFRNTMLWNVDSTEVEPNSFLAQLQANTGPIGVVDVRNFINSEEDGNLVGDGLLVDVTGYTLPGPDVAGYGMRPDSLDQFRELSRDAVAADFDSDGDVDIFVSNGSEGLGIPNTLLINNGQGRFEAVNDPGNNGYFVSANPASITTEELILHDSLSVAAGDLNGDGHIDIYSADQSEDAITNHVIWINDGTAHFTGHLITNRRLDGSLEQRSTHVMIGDFDGDGEPTEDLNGNGILDPQEDTDGDGVIDFLDLNGNNVHDADYDVFLCNINQVDQILINDGDGNFTDESTSRLYGTGGEVVRNSLEADFADVDLDGDLDIAIAQENYRGPTIEAISVQLYINEGDGTFQDMTASEIGTTQFVGYGGTPDLTDETIVQTNPWNANSSSVEFGDVDGDGDPDLYVGNVGQRGLGTLASAPNVVLINRTIGTNLNARSLRGTAPGFDNAPIPQSVSPSILSAGDPRIVTLTVKGQNFGEGASVDLGQGLTVLEASVLLPNTMSVQVQVESGIVPGPRRVVVENPNGTSGSSVPGILTISPNQLPTTDVAEWNVYR